MLLATVHQDIGMNDAQPLAQLNGPIVLAGAGKMGGPMLTGWVARGLDARQVAVLEPNPSGEISALAAKGIRLNPSPKDIGAVATLVVALKPQSFREAGSALKAFTAPSTLVVSIMAGTPIASIEEVCGGSAVPALPNTPAALGPGRTVAGAGNHFWRGPRAGAGAVPPRTARGGVLDGGRPRDAAFEGMGEGVLPDRHPCVSAMALIAGGASLFGEPRRMSTPVAHPSRRTRARTSQDDGGICGFVS